MRLCCTINTKIFLGLSLHVIISFVYDFFSSVQNIPKLECVYKYMSRGISIRLQMLLSVSQCQLLSLIDLSSTVSRTLIAGLKARKRSQGNQGRTKKYIIVFRKQV